MYRPRAVLAGLWPKRVKMARRSVNPPYTPRTIGPVLMLETCLLSYDWNPLAGSVDIRLLWLDLDGLLCGQ